ncbi:hypothetical protein CYLTODRAFT_425620 [Cylindrobasidium torrendii FP15055 ss-10]|uniref:Uncharacterized protein n=1 Tax=Cylindrobasidium torrendii FP15055 ss-10 TaxID=1314674 RepID=A0A0D7B0H4_9AGAR|nr:hypothetical protein CYLTODRAFT_425620 [Cylindrobasidium torrendii FP15055 ss-10]
MTGPDSPGILYWALEADTDLEYVTHYNLDGLNPYQSPIRYGSFYYSNEDPYAVICNTSENMIFLQTHNRWRIDHLCQWAQDLVGDFLVEHAQPITNGSLDEDHIKYYASLPLPPRSEDDEEDSEEDEPQSPPTSRNR